MKKRCSASLIFVIVLSFCSVASAESVREMFINTKHMALVYPISETETYVEIEVMPFIGITKGFLEDFNDILQKTGTKVQAKKIERDIVTGEKTITWVDLKVESNGEFVDPNTGEKRDWEDKYFFKGYFRGPELRTTGAITVRPFSFNKDGTPRWMEIKHSDAQPFVYKIENGRKLDFLSMPATGELFDTVPVLKHSTFGLDDWYDANEAFVYLTGLCRRLNGKPTYVVPAYDKMNKRWFLQETINPVDIQGTMVNSQNGDPKTWYFACSGSDKFVAKGIQERVSKTFRSTQMRIKFAAGRDLTGVTYTPLGSSK